MNSHICYNFLVVHIVPFHQRPMRKSLSFFRSRFLLCVSPSSLHIDVICNNTNFTLLVVVVAENYALNIRRVCNHYGCIYTLLFVYFFFIHFTATLLNIIIYFWKGFFHAGLQCMLLYICVVFV